MKKLSNDSHYFFGCVFQAEALVSSLGACDQAIINAGGPQAATPNVGDITVSGGFSSVGHVIHTQCCKWNNGGGEPVRTSKRYIDEYLLFIFAESLNNVGCPPGEAYPFSNRLKQLKTILARFEVISDVVYLTPL